MRDSITEALKHYDQDLETADPNALYLIRHEGFSEEVYLDTKGIATQGVGQTGDNIGKNFFTEVFPKYKRRAEAVYPGLDDLNPRVQKAIISAVYRGDLKASHNTAELMREGRWVEASEEYLNHGDYLRSKEKNDKAGRVVHGVQIRMEENSRAFASVTENCYD